MQVAPPGMTEILMRADALETDIGLRGTVYREFLIVNRHPSTAVFEDCLYRLEYIGH
jgi:hypothetical protein